MLEAGVGRRRRLPAGNVLFDKIRMLQPDELDREAILDMADHPTGGLADGDERADLGPLIAGDRSS